MEGKIKAGQPYSGRRLGQPPPLKALAWCVNVVFLVCLIGVQATLSGNILHMAGQIGLDPPTMTLVPGGAATEMKQALHNCEAVARAFDASLSRAAINFTIYCSEIAGRVGLQQVEEKLQDFLSTVDENCEAGEERGPSLQYSETSSAVPSPLVLYVLVPALPKG